MIALQNKQFQMDELLDRMAEEVQLDKTRYERMKQAYEALKNWIEDDEKFFKPYKYDVYPHGSVRIQATVKPIGRDEFDLDVALHLKTEWNLHTPQKVYDELKRRLMEHDRYKSMLELKNRCLRLNYAGDFHMDILPGIQENTTDEDKLRIPDRELGTWVSSNPRGYAKWFLGKANMVKVSLLEKSFRAEKLPADDFKNKKPLQRAVQLIKRYRDIYFQKDDRYKTSSIILTTLAGHFYNGEESIFDTIDGIVIKIRGSIGATKGRIKVFNPVNDQEDFTDKWEESPEYYKAFVAFCDHLDDEWQKLKKQNGVVTESTILKGLFGDDLLIKAQKGQAEMVETYRKAGSLGIDKKTGTLSTTVAGMTAAVKSNTFYGD